MPIRVRVVHVGRLFAAMMFAAMMLVAVAGVCSAATQSDVRPAADKADARARVGRWQASVIVNGLEVPFRFEIATVPRSDAQGNAPLRGLFVERLLDERTSAVRTTGTH